MKMRMIPARMQMAIALLVLAAAFSTECGVAYEENAASQFDVNHFKHKLGRCSQLVRDGQKKKAMGLLDKLIVQLKGWREEIAKDDAEELLENDVAKPRPEPSEFLINTTHLPKKCTRKSAEGDVLKVHFVGKLMPSKKVFDSSFHTGSMPYRFVLGSSGAKVPGWNKGLTGMCEGERRTLVIGYNDGYGEKGAKGVPPFSNLKYMVELVELSSRSRRNVKRRKGSSGDL